jgi:hypothetical protein
MAWLAGACGGNTIEFNPSTQPDAGSREDASAQRDATLDGHRDNTPDASIDRRADVKADVKADVTIDINGSGQDALTESSAGDASDDPNDPCYVCRHLPHVRPDMPVECLNGQCYVFPGGCSAGWAHCTTRGEDGCETDLSQTAHCGTCNTRCSALRPFCMPSGNTFPTYQCVYDCTPERHDVCDRKCVDLQTNVTYCGSCNHSCEADFPHGANLCEHGTCKMVGCRAGWGDCTPEAGCETRLDQPDQCGVCGNHACVVAHATPTCVSSGCGMPVCEAGFANCDTTSPDCETPFGASSCWPKYRGTAALGAAPNVPDVATRVAVGPDGAYFVAGNFGRSGDFDPTNGRDVRTPAGPYDAFITKLNADGSYAWTRTFGADGDDFIAAIAVGPDGSIYATGDIEGYVDLDPGPGTDFHGAEGESASFLLKLDASGSFVWAKTLPEQSDDGGGEGRALAVANDGSLYLGGVFGGTVDLDPGPSTFSVSAGRAGFLVKLTARGEFVWGRALGGAACNGEGVASLAVRPDASVWAIEREGDTCSIDATDRDASTDFRFAVVSFGSSGDYRGAWRIHGTFEPPSITAGSDDSMYVAGWFTDVVDFDPGPGKAERVPGYQSNSNDLSSAGFLLKLGTDGAFRWVQVMTGVDIAGVAPQGNAVLVAGRDVSTDENLGGIALLKLSADGTSIYRLLAAAGSLPTVVTGLAVGGGQILIPGYTDGLTDFDPGPGTDIVDRGAIRFVSRYGF